jgi:hypothetical protein
MRTQTGIVNNLLAANMVAGLGVKPPTSRAVQSSILLAPPSWAATAEVSDWAQISIFFAILVCIWWIGTRMTRIYADFFYHFVRKKSA